MGEQQSEMSGMSEVSTAPDIAGTAGGPRELEGGLKKWILVIVAGTLVVGLVGVILIVSDEASEPTEEAGKAEAAPGGDGKAAATGSDGGEEKKKSPTSKVTGVSKPPPVSTKSPYLLLCTVSSHAFFKGQFPPDGLCDILFYTNAYYETKDADFRGAYHKYSFNVFRNQARSYRGKMTYGVSFDYQHASNTSAALADTTKNEVNKLWMDKIYHYGILQAWDGPDNLRAPNDKLDLIKILKAETDKIKKVVTVELVIGFQFQYGNQMTDFKDVASHLLTAYPITVLVAISHLFKKKTDSFHFSSGPSDWDVLESRECPHKMEPIAKLLSSSNIRNGSTVMVSFTMSCIYWRLNNTNYPNGIDLNIDGFWRYNDFTPVEHAQICVENHALPVLLEKTGYFIYTGSSEKLFLLACDNATTLKTKMEKFFQLVGAHPGRMGWAVYDVDFDDYTNKCKYPANFQGLRTVSKFLRSLKKPKP